MDKQRSAAPHTTGGTAPQTKDAAKVGSSSDLYKVFLFFRYKEGTSLDCAKETGILRNSITYYIAYLESIKELAAVAVRRDKTTGHMAKHYSADKSTWHQQPTLFDDWEDTL